MSANFLVLFRDFVGIGRSLIVVDDFYGYKFRENNVVLYTGGIALCVGLDIDTKRNMVCSTPTGWYKTKDSRTGTINKAMR